MGKLISAISVKKLSFSYNENLVFENASINFTSFKFTVILGKNGSGKSTLLRIIAGLQPYKHGQVFFHNQELTTIGFSKRASIFGFLSQQHKAIFPFTVEEVVITGRSCYINFVPSKHDTEKAIDAMKQADILHLRDRYYTELSGGEKQLVMIARVLAQEPQILLLDEPTTHLDFCNQAHLLKLLKKLTNDGLTVIAVLHDPNSAFLYADDFVFVKENKLVRVEEPYKPWDIEFLESVYKTGLNSIPFLNRAIILPAIQK